MGKRGFRKDFSTERKKQNKRESKSLCYEYQEAALLFHSETKGQKQAKAKGTPGYACKQVTLPPDGSAK